MTLFALRCFPWCNCVSDLLLFWSGQAVVKQGNQCTLEVAPILPQPLLTHLGWQVESFSDHLGVCLVYAHCCKLLFPATRRWLFALAAAFAVGCGLPATDIASYSAAKVAPLSLLLFI